MTFLYKFIGIPLVTVALVFSFTAPVSAATCSNYYQPNVAVPTGYGAAYNVFSSGKELSVQADCSGTTPIVKVGSGVATQYIYKIGYAYKGGSWQQVNLTGSSALIASNWYAANAQGTLPFAASDLSSWNYIVGYVCSWSGTAWQCGCADTTCSAGNWQLQAIQISGSTVGGGTPTGAFHVAGGKIIDPQGAQYMAHGINAGGDPSIAQAIINLFPGINFVRYADGGHPSASSLQNFVTTLTAQKIVVEIENHPWPLEHSLSGQALTDETNWYASLATVFKDNPYVWFGTMNEPQNGYGSDEAGISEEQLATYQAIRGAGSNAMLMLEAGVGGGNPQTVGAGSGLIESDYAGMTNVAWDLHFYGWVADYSTDQNTVNNALLGSPGTHTGIAAAQTIRSADGIIPVINGEFGPSTSGASMDANANQVISAVTNFGPANGSSGYAGWHWNADPNNALQNNGNLTNWGQQLEAAIHAAH